MKKYKILLTGTTPKYLHYHLEKLMNMKLLQGKNKLNLEKASPKQTKPKVATLMSLNEFLKFHSILPEIVMNDLIRAKLKQIVNLQDIIKPDELHCKSKRRKIYNLANIFYLVF